MFKEKGGRLQKTEGQKASKGPPQVWVWEAECSRAWATQGDWNYTVARIKIWAKSGRKVIFSEGVDGKAVVCDIKKGDSAGLIVYENPNPARGHGHGEEQGTGRVLVGSIFMFMVQPNHPVAILRLVSGVNIAIVRKLVDREWRSHSIAAHAQDPVSLLGHIHFPVMFS